MARNDNTDMIRSPIDLAKTMFGGQQNYVSRHVQPKQQQERQMLVGIVPVMPVVEELIDGLEMNNWEMPNTGLRL